MKHVYILLGSVILLFFVAIAVFGTKPFGDVPVDPALQPQNEFMAVPGTVTFIHESECHLQTENVDFFGIPGGYWILDPTTVPDWVTVDVFASTIGESSLELNYNCSGEPSQTATLSIGLVDQRDTPIGVTEVVLEVK